LTPGLTSGINRTNQEQEQAMVSAHADATLRRLRQELVTIEKNTCFSEDAGVLPLGLAAADATLGGGLARGALHDLAPAVPAQFGAAAGFALAVAALATAGSGRPVLVIQTDFGRLETGAPYGPGLEAFGLPLALLLLLRVPRPLDVLWAFEEALKSRGVAIVIAELPEDGPVADLTITQRLTLAARAGGGLGLLLRQRCSRLATAAATRWQVAAAPSVPDRYGGLGRTTFDLALNRNKRGRCGRFLLCWDHHDRIFLPTLSVGVAAAASDGSADPRPLARAG
jgi:protein ImuA